MSESNIQRRLSPLPGLPTDGLELVLCCICFEMKTVPELATSLVNGHRVTWDVCKGCAAAAGVVEDT